MNKNTNINTKTRGLYEFLVYKEHNKYVGVCLTLNIVEEGVDPKKILNSLISATMGHIKIVSRKNLSDELLNRPAPKYYWDKLDRFKKLKEKINSAKEDDKIKSTSSYFDTTHLDIPLELLSHYSYNAQWLK